MRLIAILAVIALASSIGVAADSCDLGPTFWCENQDNAKTCNAVDYCNTYAWDTQGVEMDGTVISDASCTDCTRFVTSLRSFLANESLVFAQDLVLDLFCRNMGRFRQQCETSVKTFLPSISKILIPLINPTNVCQQMKLCQQSVQDSESNSAHFDFSFVSWSEIPEEQENFNGPKRICADCYNFMKAAKLMSSQFRPLIKDLMLKTVCPNFKEMAKSECEMIAKTILPEVFDMIVRNFDAKKACSLIKVCSKTEESVGGSAPFENSIWFLNDENSFPSGDILKNEWSVLKETKSCTDCKNFLNALTRFLQAETLTFVQDVILEQVCPRMGRYKPQCEEITKNYLPPTIKVLLSMIDAQKTCSAMRVCPRKMLAEEDQDKELPDFERQLDLIDFEKLIGFLDNPKVLNKTKCEVCKQTLQYVKDLLQDQSIRSTLELVFGQFVCGLLGPMHLPCKMIVKTLIPAVFNALAQLLKNPDKICRFIRVCATLEATVGESTATFDDTQDDFEAELGEPIVEEQESVDECLICQRIAQNLGNFLRLGETSIALQDLAKIFCQDFSEQEKSACVSVVKKFNPTLINRLSAVISPKFFCEKVRICPTVSDFGRSYRGNPQRLGERYEKVLHL